MPALPDGLTVVLKRDCPTCVMVVPVRDDGSLVMVEQFRFLGDRVSLELSPYDLGKGRITFRHLPPRSGVAPALAARAPRR